MPLFRPHRGTLEDSLKRTVIVNNIHDLCQEVQKEVESWVNTPITPEYIIIEDYCFDERIGWHTQIVKTSILHANQNFGVIGFLSEPLLYQPLTFEAKIDELFDPSEFKLIPREIKICDVDEFAQALNKNKTIDDFELGSAYCGSFETRRKCYDIDILMQSDKWIWGLPFIQWPGHYLIKVTPPFGAKVIRFRLKTTDTPHELSIYLDGYNFSGCMPWPHYEVFGGLGDDCSRCKWDDVEGLLDIVYKHFYGFPEEEE